MDKKKINRKGCRKDRSFRERESGEGESLHKMAAEEQRALFVDGENEVKGAKVSTSSINSESVEKGKGQKQKHEQLRLVQWVEQEQLVGLERVNRKLNDQGAREDDMENEIAEMDKFDLGVVEERRGVEIENIVDGHREICEIMDRYPVPHLRILDRSPSSGSP
nr:hypothetical protein Iba_chr07dCG4970 [Ipomoea batatas]